MKFCLCCCTLWMTFYTIRAPQTPEETRQSALTFTLSHDRFYELEEIQVLVARDKEGKKPIDKQKLYFSHMLFACPGPKTHEPTIERTSTKTKPLFVDDVILAECVSNFVFTPPTCGKKFRPTAIAVKRLNGQYTLDMDNEPSDRQEYRIGYEINDYHDKLNENHLPPFQRFDGMAEGIGWLEAFRVIYDTKKMVVKQVYYELHYIGESLKISAQCHDYDVGRTAKLLKQVNFKSAYHYNQQNGALSDTQAYYSYKRRKLSSDRATASNAGPAVAASSQASQSEEPLAQDDSASQLVKYEPMDTDDNNDTVDAQPPESTPPNTDDDESTLPDADDDETTLPDADDDETTLPDADDDETTLPNAEDDDQQVITDAEPLRAIKPKCVNSGEKCCLGALLRLKTSVKPTPVPPVKIPEHADKPEPSKPAKKTEDDDIFKVPPTVERFKMQQLVPIEYFDVSSIQAATCSYLVVAPMWQSLADGAWDKIDLAIRKVLDVIDTLRVIAGTHEVLRLPVQKKPSSKRSAKVRQPEPEITKEIAMRSFNRSVTVPSLFYKFVVHKVFPPGVDTKPMLYAILIVMHNQLTKPRPHEMICPTDDCVRFGWNVTNDDERTGSPYCCYPTSSILEKLGIRYSPLTGVFNLNAVLAGFDRYGAPIMKNYNLELNGENAAAAAAKKRKTKTFGEIFGDSDDG